MRWLLALERELRRQGVAVSFASPSQAWDLQVSRTAVLAARVGTAVQWGWTPQVRMRVVLRPRRLLGLAGALALAARTGLRVPVLGAAAAVELLVEVAVLVPAVRDAVRRTVASAQPASQGPDGRPD